MLDEALQEFITESIENLDRFERRMVELESAPSDHAILNELFRAIHTIKGTAGFFHFSQVESLGHAGENVLGVLRDGKATLTPESTSALLAMGDALRGMIVNIQNCGDEGEPETQALVQTLRALAEAPEAGAVPAHRPVPPSAAPHLLHTSSGTMQNVAIEMRAYLPPPIHRPEVPAPRFTPGASPPLLAVAQRPALAPPPIVHSSVPRTAPGVSPAYAEPLTPTLGATMTLPAMTQTSAVPILRATEQHAAPEAAESVRIDVGLLDHLMDLVGELVLTRNQVLMQTARQQDVTLQRTTQRLGAIVSELQAGITKTRMQPIGNVWQKLPRVVRDLALSCQKKIAVLMEGKETELDRTLLEAIKDPLTHLVRNSVDHGIELPEARLAKGKPAEGMLRLRAFHEGGKVIIEITDDGGGIDPHKIKRKAIEKGLLGEEQAAQLSEKELLSLIFLPGFSTAEQVTKISGRGVGMDVVKTNIEKINGTIELKSEVGAGTTFQIRIPLTLAIVPALLVSAGGRPYAIPQAHLVEVVRVSDPARIESLHGAPVYRLRDQLLPLLSLNQRLGVPHLGSEAPRHIVVLQADGAPFGLVVEQVKDTVEIVVKPLSKKLKDLDLYAGATILGDGQVALILDIGRLAPRHVQPVRATQAKTIQKSEGQSFLLCAVGSSRLAFPLREVTRLERISAAAIERSGGREVIQYRGKIVPVLWLAALLDVGPSQAHDPLELLVLEREGETFGLVIDEIVDVIDACEPPKRRANREGLIGSAVLQGRVTDFVDESVVFHAARAHGGGHA